MKTGEKRHLLHLVKYFDNIFGDFNYDSDFILICI